MKAWLAFLALSAGGLSLEPTENSPAQENQGRSCIALAVFTEARGESIDGQIAVAEVIKARMDAEGWPSDPCDVVSQLHQFHGFRDWPRDSRNPIYPWEVDQAAWQTALDVTDGVMLHGWSACKGADHFYAGQPPTWAKPMRVRCELGNHTFLASQP